MKTRKLSQAIKRGETAITSVGLRMPDTGALRGLKLTDVLQMDVNAMCRLLPRITDPALMPDEVVALPPADLLMLSSEVVSFFVTDEMVAEEQRRQQ